MRYAMIERCYNPHCKAYRNCGARGIKVCEEWASSFKLFVSFALSHGYKTSLEIDRINNDGDYEPSNIHFVDRKANCRNRRNNTMITIGGETKTLIEWAEWSGVRRATIGWRLKHGYKEEDLLQNTRKLYEINGEKKTSSEWAELIGIDVETFRKRVSMGYVGKKLLAPYSYKKAYRSSLRKLISNPLSFYTTN